MNNYYYHCYYCNNIPSIDINEENVKITCDKDHEKTLTISEFCQKCIKKCECENCFYFKNGKTQLCPKCSKEITMINQIKLIKNNISEQDLLDDNKSLDLFIKEINAKIEETKNILEKMKKELLIYKSLLYLIKKYILFV